MALPHHKNGIDRSGTLASGNVAQTIANANDNRRYFVFENVSSGDLWINFGSAAVLNQPSFKVVANGSIVMEGTFCDTQYVSVIGATNGQAFTAKEA